FRYTLGKAIPVVGGVISGGFDFAETKIIANRAYQMFIMGDFSTSTEDQEIESLLDDVKFELIEDDEETLK
ncbi:MAG TPA: hypothetical protein DCO69_02005, partial [Clostridiales bacterium]|nr:hypothetical protein [Clostridiales bacterium]